MIFKKTSCYVVVLIITEILDINISLKEVNTFPQMHLFPPQQSLKKCKTSCSILNNHIICLIHLFTSRIKIVTPSCCHMHTCMYSARIKAYSLSCLYNVTAIQQFIKLRLYGEGYKYIVTEGNIIYL